jgi:tetratricopeptide (TPR) repeat protein
LTFQSNEFIIYHTLQVKLLTLKVQRFILFISFLLFSCNQNTPRRSITSPNRFYDQAFELRERKQPDSAFAYFDKAKALFLANKDTLGAGKCLVNMAIIATDQGDYFGGQELSIAAFSFFNRTEKDHLPYLKSNINNLGIASYNLKNYDQAIAFYKQSLNYKPDLSARLVIENNIANAYSMKGNFSKALSLYQHVLAESKTNEINYARSLTNVAMTKWRQSKTYNAAPELLIALAIRLRAEDNWGLNSSYAHLSEFYEDRNLDSARIYAIKRYHWAKQNTNVDDEISALRQLIRVSPHQNIRTYFLIQQSLTDSVQTARNAAKNQFALIRYESEKSKTDNLKLQKENAEKRLHIVKQNAVILIALLLFLLGAVYARLWYRKRNQGMELASKNAIKDSQLQTSKRVHDVVANGLYRMMAEIENQQVFDKDDILDKIEDLYEKSRDISYEKPAKMQQDFSQQLSLSLRSFATTSIKVAIAGNSAELWQDVSPDIRFELTTVLQELMVNMSKHSNATNVVIRFERMEKLFHIYYQDNGIGIADNVTFNNGLTNTGNRMASMGGTITFETIAEHGLKIHICLPFS